ncbi:MAG: hypothetical protein LC130_24390 [Bryobacterales bacterium]|nr:hypothetical protein [Bryobacterales bacterium]
MTDNNALDVLCSIESLSLLYLNPPYQFESGEGRNARMEQVFLEHCYRWLKPGGVLILVVPGDKLHVCDQVLAARCSRNQHCLFVVAVHGYRDGTVPLNDAGALENRVTNW